MSSAIEIVAIRRLDGKSAVLREAGRDRAPQPPQSWIDDTDLAVADVEGRR